MTTQLEILISEADAVSARAIGAAFEVRDLLMRRPKGVRWHAETPDREARSSSLKAAAPTRRRET
jgi:hypothetical protein